MPFKKNTLKQFILYAGFGLFGTATQYVVLVALVELANISPVISTAFGYFLGAIVNYILNYHITFKSNKKHHEALLKFLIIASIGMALNILIMHIGVTAYSSHYILVQIIATAIVLLWNFILNSIWTFAPQGAKD